MSICTKDHIGAVPAAVHSLPKSQAGAWRHKCAACAYDLGYQDGIGAADKLRARVRELEARLKDLAPAPSTTGAAAR